MSLKPGGVFCPWCTAPIEPGQDTARHRGRLFHGPCVEELLQADSEIAQVQDAER